MSDNVIQFPTKEIRDWKSASETIKELLVKGGMSESDIIEFLSFFT